MDDGLVWFNTLVKLASVMVITSQKSTLYCGYYCGLLVHCDGLTHVSLS